MVMAVVLTLTACTAGTSKDAALAQATQLNKNKTALAEVTTTSMLGLIQISSKETLLQHQQRIAQKLINNEARLIKAVNKTKKYAGKTWYVFSGASPRGWDCSGLVAWTYGQMGVTLKHSATRQLHSGHVVKEPRVGDIVAFYYGNGRYSFHVGLYIGKGKMIHAYMPGTRTRIDSVKKVAKDNWAKYKFVRIVAQPAVATTS